MTTKISLPWRAGVLMAALLSFASPGFAADLAEEVRAMIGKEYERGPIPHPFGEGNCTMEGGGAVVVAQKEVPGWGLDQLACGDRIVMLLVRPTVTFPNPYAKWRVVDSLLLPPIKKGVRFFETGDCDLDGKIGTDFFSLARLGKREDVDYRTGVLAAWGLDLEAGKFVELSTKRVTCHRPTPP
jgi:hypothetical protein